MRDRLLKRRAAQSLIPRLAPPFDREVVEPGLGEVMRDSLGLRASKDERLRCPAVQRLAAALEQAIVGRVLDQRVLEAIVRVMARALGDEEIRASEPVERRL